MTTKEQTNLEKLIRFRARTAKARVDVHTAQRLADVESQLSARFPITHEAWKDIAAQAEEVVRAADAEIAKRCEAMGIEPEFRPRLVAEWYHRGENASKERRQELHAAALAKIAADGKAFKVSIDCWQGECLTQLAAGVLLSADAKAFLNSMPSIEQLMPRVMIEEMAPIRKISSCSD